MNWMTLQKDQWTWDRAINTIRIKVWKEKQTNKKYTEAMSLLAGQCACMLSR